MAKPEITAGKILALKKDGCTLKEIGAILGCSTSKVSYTITGRNKKPVTKSSCGVCGCEIEYLGNAVKYVCSDPNCKRIMAARRVKEQYQSAIDRGAIRPYSYTTNYYIVNCLNEGMDTVAIANLFDRDAEDLENHVQKMRDDGTFDKIQKHIALYKRENTLRTSTALV